MLPANGASVNGMQSPATPPPLQAEGLRPEDVKLKGTGIGNGGAGTPPGTTTPPAARSPQGSTLVQPIASSPSANLAPKSAVPSPSPSGAAAAVVPSASTPHAPASGASAASEITPSKSALTPASTPISSTKQGAQALAMSPASPTPAKTGAAAATAEAAAAPAADAGPTPNAAPPPISLILKTSADDISDAARRGIATAKALIASLKDKKQPFNITLDQLIVALFFTGLIFQALVMKLFLPSWLYVASSTLLGVGLGLALSFLYYNNKKEKAEVNQMLGLNPGLKGLKFLVGELPSWLSYTEGEKIEWFNSMLVELWPFVDKAVCRTIKTSVEELCANTIRTQKVPIKKIGFKQLTFGDAPFRIESIWVNESNEQGMEMEVGIRWCGDANITLAIELSGDMTKMCPRVTDITFVANAKIRLSPLVDKIPGFAGIMFCMTKPPRIGYNLNIGKALGGSVVSSVVKPFIQNIVQYQIVNMLVWPQRLVIPVPLPDLLGDPGIQLEVQRMALRNQGVLKVVVKAGDSLKAADIALMGGKATSDPFVELSTDGKYVVRTKVVKKSLDPVWEQTFFLLVQEPTNQTMPVTVYDQDLSGDEIIGRTLVKLPPVCKEEKKELTSWYYLGPGDWADPAGCGKGNGKIQLAMTYRSIGSFLPAEPRDAVMGIAIVRVHKVYHMGFGKQPVTLYCLVECNGEKWESGNAFAKDGNDHLFNFNNTKAFYDVRFDMDVKLTVIQRAMGGAGNEEVGLFEMPITDIAEAQDVDPFAGRPIPGFWSRHARLEESDNGIIHMTLRYVPYI